VRRRLLVNLRRKDIVKGHICLRVRKNWQPKHGHERDVPLLPEARAVLDEMVPDFRSEYLFTSPTNRKWNGDNLYHAVKDVYELAGLERASELNVHTLRHTFNSRLAEEGISREVRAKIMGHASLDLQDRYTHLEPKVVNEAIAGLKLYGRSRAAARRA